MNNKNWRHQSIAFLEQTNYDNPDESSTEMVKRCRELCRIPVGTLTASDLRLMIGQGFALQYLIPLALEHLREDLFIEADFYPGDLLKNILTVDAQFWANHKNLWEETNNLIRNRNKELELHQLNTSLFNSVFLSY